MIQTLNLLHNYRFRQSSTLDARSSSTLVGIMGAHEDARRKSGCWGRVGPLPLLDTNTLASECLVEFPLCVGQLGKWVGKWPCPTIFFKRYPLPPRLAPLLFYSYSLANAKWFYPSRERWERVKTASAYAVLLQAPAWERVTVTLSLPERPKPSTLLFYCLTPDNITR